MVGFIGLKAVRWLRATIAVTLGESLRVRSVAGFAKFDPHAFLEREKRIAANIGLVQTLNGSPHRANDPITLGGLATLVATPSHNENQDVWRSSKIDARHQFGEIDLSKIVHVKAAKVAKVDPIPASSEETAWGEAQGERAAIVEYDGGAPRVWAEALARLDPSRPPCDMSPKRWLQFIDDCGRFLDGGWGNRAEDLGWGPLELFGCDRVKPFARLDRAGLLWLLNGGKLVALTAVTATIETISGARQTYRRCRIEVDAIAPAWELAQ